MMPRRRIRPPLRRIVDQRRPKVPWGCLDKSDLCPQGDPEYLSETNIEKRLGLRTLRADGTELGWLAIRCEKRNGRIHPMTIAITAAIT
jgi:hypothetical protein